MMLTNDKKIEDIKPTQESFKAAVDIFLLINRL